MAAKQTLYFIPGTMCDHGIWSRIWPDLQHDFELIHLPVPTEYEFTVLLHHLIEQLPDEKVNLIGFSMGGYLAACIAQYKPELIKRLLVISNSPCALPNEEVQQRQQTLNWLKKFQYAGITEQKINQMLAQCHQQDQALKQLIRDMELRLGYDRLVQQLTATTKREELAELVTQPNRYFCYGDEDKLVNAQWLKQKVAPSHLYQFNQCGHMLPLEQPRLLVELIQTLFSHNGEGQRQ